MTRYNLLRPLLVALLASAPLLVGSTAWAAPEHIRGTIASVNGAAVTIKTREGKDVSLTLDDSWKLGGVAAGSIGDIKQGEFIGTANMEGPNGNKALEVVVFPDALRGTGEGDYGWDLQAGSKMTNATVSSEVQGVDGQTVTLSYKGGTKKVAIGKTIPIVKIVSADKADMKPGAKVFMVTEPKADGSLPGGRIVVGKDGVTPPM